jgi:hypothetical protein
MDAEACGPGGRHYEEDENPKLQEVKRRREEMAQLRLMAKQGGDRG